MQSPWPVPQREVPTVTPEEICDGRERAVCGSSLSENSDLKQTCILRDEFEEQCVGDPVAGTWNKSSLPRVRLGNRDGWWNGHHLPKVCLIGQQRHCEAGWRWLFPIPELRGLRSKGSTSRDVSVGHKHPGEL